MRHPRREPVRRHATLVLALLAVATLAACAKPQPVPQPGLLGVGTPGVASHMPAEEPTSVQALLERCGPMPPESGTPPRPQSFAAACEELQRTLRNQPGNSVSAEGTVLPGG
ncbi:hypothetical protein E0493_18285 [Roseomonas sp. M0104]|uniref:Uncharacterized protein n=1 Tax=Teichococcus coralli TaxID=2545983 RepID=A0A845BPG6_9PROT|nr:hypothetical protein [Pseudoroseomonas coralli]MXP65299.1 hypothetical protein [Pseudoroseomonas coralli]